MARFDPWPIVIEGTRDVRAELANVSFEAADGGDLPLPDASFDTAVLHRVLSAAPAPEELLDEAFRVLRPGGPVVVFDGDYAASADPAIITPPTITPRRRGPMPLTLKRSHQAGARQRVSCRRVSGCVLAATTVGRQRSDC